MTEYDGSSTKCSQNTKMKIIHELFKGEQIVINF